MIVQPPQGMGDPNAQRRQNLMAQLLQGSPMPQQQPNPAAGMTQGLQQMMQRPDMMKWLGSLFSAAGSAPASMGPFYNPATGQGS